MSYQEKNITVSLVSYLLIMGYYLVNLFQMLQEGGLVSTKFFSLWALVILATIIVNIIASILTNIVLTIVEAIKAQKYDEPRFIADERDQLIGLKGIRSSYIAFSVGVLVSVLAFAFGQPPLVMVSLIIFLPLPQKSLGIFHRSTFTEEGSKMEKRQVRNNIRKLRFHHDEMTQEQLAEKVGVTRQTIIAIEGAKYPPSLELAFRIALVFDVPLGEVFSYDPEDDSNQTINKIS